jgi:hypothetical protein
MTIATLASIDTALLAALAACVATPQTAPAPFALVARYAGPVTREGLSRVCGGQYPAALLRFDGEVPTRIVNTLLAGIEDRGIAAWSVIVVSEEPREIDDAINASAVGAPGILQLLDIAMGAVNGLLIDGLWNQRPARVSSTTPELVEAGVVYAYAARVEAMRDLPLAVNVDPGAALPLLNPVIGDVNLTGTGYTSNPLVAFESEPNP